MKPLMKLVISILIVDSVMFPSHPSSHHMNPSVSEACDILKALSADEKLRIEAMDREKAWRDYMDRMEGAKEDGIVEGVAKGYNDMIISMLNNGISPEQTATIAMMSVEEVLAIKASAMQN